MSQVLLGVVQALAHTHSRGIVHRDLTAANVLLAPYSSSGPGSSGASSYGSSGPGCAKLVDFGLAKQVSGSLVQQSVVGTLAYSCPELVTQDRWAERLLCHGALAWMDVQKRLSE